MADQLMAICGASESVVRHWRDWLIVVNPGVGVELASTAPATY
jgi:hypothetical protein